MQLSIEAIIVLVIAMVLLGLGLTFVRGFFKTGTDKLQEPFDAIEFGCDPSASDPITISPSALEVKAGDDIEPKICLYATIPADPAILGIKSCKSATSDTLKPTLLAASQKIDRTEIGGFPTILSAIDQATGDDLPVGRYICTLEAVVADEYDGTAEAFATKQVTITIT